MSTTFLEHHLGTDMLFASWLLFFSAVLFLVIMVIYLSITDFYTSETSSVFNLAILFVASVIYTYASWLFVAVSYPVEYEKLIAQISAANINAMTWQEKYLTGNTLLEASWWLFIGTVPLIIYPIWAVSTGSLSILYGVLYLTAVVTILAFLALWVVACFPEHLLMHAGRGSSYLYDWVIQGVCCGCCCKEFWQIHFGSDFLASTWAIFIFASFTTVLSLTYTIYDYTYYLSWLWLIDSFLFAVGSWVLVYTSYQENMGSTAAYDFISCTKREKVAHSREETESLVQHRNVETSKAV